MARVFKFVDIFGCELHTITDPKDKLPIPANAQQVSIGPMTMRVESVRTVGSSTNPRILPFIMSASGYKLLRQTPSVVTVFYGFRLAKKRATHHADTDDTRISVDSEVLAH